VNQEKMNRVLLRKVDPYVYAKNVDVCMVFPI
jgi:hypothetical protein